MIIPKVKSKDLLKVTDLSKEEILKIFGLTTDLKSDLKNGICNYYLKNKTLAMIFEKSSTRTRVSFETGIQQLGGFGLFLSGDDTQIGRGETFSDTAKVLSRYVDGIMIRTFSQEQVEALSKNSAVPVINGLTDTFHPCQSLADYFTIYEREDDISKVKLVYVGDGNNMANSLLLGASILGVNISIATPKKYSLPDDIIEIAVSLAADSGADIEITNNIDEAVKNADYIYTDVWISMGQEKEASERKKDFADYKVTRDLVKKCSDNCKVMHCLPAHRGEEIDGDVLDSSSSIVFDQAENRLHIQKAIMCVLMTDK